MKKEIKKVSPPDNQTNGKYEILPLEIMEGQPVKLLMFSFRSTKKGKKIQVATKLAVN